MYRLWIIIALIYIGIISGCTKYHPMPITLKAVNKKLKSPDMEEVRLLAQGLKHPLIKPIRFNIRDGLSPAEAAILAVISNPTLRSVRDNRGIASAQLLQAGILPNFKFSYDFGKLVGGNTYDKVNSLGFGLSWDIISLISRSARRDAAKLHSTAVDIEIEWKEWQVAESARLHTYHIIIAKQRLLTINNATKYLQLLLEKVKQGIGIGVKTQMDLATVKFTLHKVKLQKLDVQSKIKQESLMLNRIFGFHPRNIISFEKDITWRFKPLNEKFLLKDIEKKRLDLLALRIGYKSQEARVRAAIRSQFPKINIGLIGERDTEGSQTLGIGVSIGIPFFNRNQGIIARERASRQQLFDEYVNRLFETRADIYQILEAIKITRSKLIAINKSLFAKKIFIENLRNAVNAGQSNIFSYYKEMFGFYKEQLYKIDLEQNMVDLYIAVEIVSGCYNLIYTEKSFPKKLEQKGVIGVLK